MNLRSWLRQRRDHPLREKFISHVLDRDAPDVLLASADPSSEDDTVMRAVQKAGGSVRSAALADRADVEDGLPLLGTYDGVVVMPGSSPGLSQIGMRMLSRVARDGAVLFWNVDPESHLGTELQKLAEVWAGHQEGVSEATDRLLSCLRTLELHRGQEGIVAFVVMNRSTFLRVAEVEVNDYLTHRARAGRVLAEVPARQLRNHSQVEQSPSPVKHEQFEVLDAPPLFLREYHDVVASPKQILTQSGVVLPDSFRKPMKQSPGHKTIRSATYKMVTFGAARLEPQDLPGSYFYLDSEFRGHFGHAVTEQLSRLWAWRQVKEHDPDVKCLMLNRVNLPTPRPILEFERLLYSAAGVAPEDLHLAEGAQRVEHMYAATPAFAQPQYVHPSVADMWRETGERLVGMTEDRGRPRRVFCGRKHDKRSCRNAAAVEQLFIDHGFTVIYPEDYPLPEQVAIFRDAEVVAGYAGSALFTAMFVDRPTHLILVSSESYSAENEYMIAAVLGHRVSVAWCRADLESIPGSGFQKDVFHSSYAFDFSREGVFLEQVLKAL